jgi:hypothetical protein
MIYQKGPVKLHFAKVLALGDNFVRGSVPDENGGELVRLDDYYNGAFLRLYQADNGVPQEAEIVDYDSANIVFHLRHPFSPKPSGKDMRYEISPLFPESYDSIYALDTALVLLGPRVKTSQTRLLQVQREEAWMAARNFFLSTVSDRGPARVIPYPEDTPDTGYEQPAIW